MQIIKVPFINGLGKTKGCEKAPEAIVSELSGIYTNEKNIVSEISRHNVTKININQENLDESEKMIYNESRKIFAKNDFSLFLGGDHSISYPLCRAFSESFANPGIVIFDAHADCVHDFYPPTHEDWLRTLVSKGFKPGNVILAGLRNVHSIEKDFISAKKIRCFMQKDIFGNLHDICDAIMETARKFDALYLSIDIDAVDPAFAPAVAYPEPAGLSSREIIYFIQRLNMLKNLRAADISEVNPLKDFNNITSKLAAKITAELIR
ncbi:MAG: arginase family protein [archaeon]